MNTYMYQINIWKGLKEQLGQICLSQPDQPVVLVLQRQMAALRLNGGEPKERQT